MLFFPTFLFLKKFAGNLDLKRYKSVPLNLHSHISPSIGLEIYINILFWCWLVLSPEKWSPISVLGSQAHLQCALSFCQAHYPIFILYWICYLASKWWSVFFLRQGRLVNIQSQKRGNLPHLASYSPFTLALIGCMSFLSLWSELVNFVCMLHPIHDGRTVDFIL